ncbi:hypothetical protein GCM10023310_55980 [Paenibacillus vulneris]
MIRDGLPLRMLLDADGDIGDDPLLQLFGIDHSFAIDENDLGASRIGIGMGGNAYIIGMGEIGAKRLLIPACQHLGGLASG